MSVVFHVVGLNKHQSITELEVSNYDSNWYAGVDLKVGDIPSDTDIIRFYVAWESITINSDTMTYGEGYWFYNDNLKKKGDLVRNYYYYG